MKVPLRAWHKNWRALIEMIPDSKVREMQEFVEDSFRNQTPSAAEIDNAVVLVCERYQPAPGRPHPNARDIVARIFDVRRVTLVIKDDPEHAALMDECRRRIRTAPTHSECWDACCGSDDSIPGGARIQRVEDFTALRQYAARLHPNMPRLMDHMPNGEAIALIACPTWETIHAGGDTESLASHLADGLTAGKEQRRPDAHESAADRYQREAGEEG